jgi:hypothetical protein
VYKNAICFFALKYAKSLPDFQERIHFFINLLLINILRGLLQVISTAGKNVEIMEWFLGAVAVSSNQSLK